MLAIWVKVEGYGKETVSVPMARATGCDVADSHVPFELRDGAALVSEHRSLEDAERVALERNSPWALTP